MNSHLIRKNAGEKIFDICNYSFMGIFCITILFPFWDTFIISVSTPNDALAMTLHLWPRKWEFNAYIFALTNPNIYMALLISVYSAIIGTALHLVVVLFAAYPLSKKDLPFRNQLTVFYLIPMFFDGGLIPSYIINRSLGLVNNLLVYILPSAVGIFVILLVRNFLMSLDKSLEESAYIDGAGHFKILYFIILPLSKPIIATVALWSMVAHWNDWFTSLIYIRDDKKIVLQMVLRRMIDDANKVVQEMAAFTAVNQNKRLTPRTTQAAVTIITVFPIVCSYPFLQKYFVKGIMIGSLKG